MKVLFFSVIYPGVELFLYDFFHSLEMQTNDEFFLVLVNDGVGDISHYVEGFDASRIAVLNSGGSPAENRMIGIRHAIEVGAEYIVFGDSDDFFSNNRVDICVELLDAGWDIVVNDLTIVNSEGKILDLDYLSKRIEGGAEIRFPLIRSKNCFGLSNTAVRTLHLKEFTSPHDLVALDWYLFSTLLLHRRRAVFTADATTHYRQHSANTVGVGALEEEGIIRQLDAKVRHYKAMGEISDQYEDGAWYERTLEQLQNNPKLIPGYVNYLKKNAVKNPLWWENILPTDQNYEM